MGKKTVLQKVLEELFFVLLGTALSFALVLSVYTASVFETEPMTLLFYSFVTNLILRLILQNKYTGGIFVGGLVLLGGILFFQLLSQENPSDWFLNLKGIAFDFRSFLYDYRNYQSDYDSLLTVLISVGLSSVTALCLRWHYGIYLLAAVGAVVFSIPLVQGWNRSQLALLLFLSGCIVLLYYRMSSLAAKDEEGVSRLYTGYGFAILPVCFLLFLAAWMVPKPEIEGQNLLGVFTGTYQDGVEKEMTFSRLDTGLGGPSHQSDELIMRVEGPKDVYLTGLVFDTYTGSSWELRDSSIGELLNKQEDRYQTVNYPSDLHRFQTRLLEENSWNQSTVSVTLAGAKTSMVFVPPFRQTLQTEYKGSIYYNYSGQMWSRRPQRKGTSYTQSYYQFPKGNETVEVYLRGAPPLSATEEEELSRYQMIPVNLPPEVGTLAAQITSGYGTTYDKVKALESYLQQFPYTLTPGPVPEDTDFVAHFLFQEQQGYCVYYATALTVMARTQGIPARYVEGFVMPKDLNPDGTYHVTGKQAHAWAEVYFPNFGWIAFEPTPPNYSQLYRPLPQIEEPLQTDLESLELQDPEEDIPILSESEQEDLVEQTESESLEKGNGEKGSSSKVGKVLKGLLLLGLLVGGSILLLSLAIRQRETMLKTIEALPYKEGVVSYYSQLLRLLSYHGFVMEPGETVAVFSQRIQLVQPLPIDLISLMEVFERATYSNSEISEEERNLLQKAYQQGVSHTKQQEKHPLIHYYNIYIRRLF